MSDLIERLPANVQLQIKIVEDPQWAADEIERIKKLLKETIDVEIEQVDEIERNLEREKNMRKEIRHLNERIAKLEAVANSLITDLALCEVKLEEALEAK